MPGDTFETHVEDTMIAGAGISTGARPSSSSSRTRRSRSSGSSRWACRSTSDAEALHLTREGGHSHRRIVHVDDATGWAVQAGAGEDRRGPSQHHACCRDRRASTWSPGGMRSAIRASGRVRGLYALNGKSGKVERMSARATVLASGGAGRVLPILDRAARRDGRRHRDGVARGLPHLQYGIHAVPPDLPLQSGRQEFPDHRGGARRGRHPRSGPGCTGAPLSCPVTTRAELAPRDIVARAIDNQIKRSGLDYVHLDISHQDPEFVDGHFPNIYEKLLTLGIDIDQASRSPSCLRSITRAAAC